MTALLVCLTSAAFMAGLSWFVGVVHYPLFAAVGPGEWLAYHRRHSTRTTFVVVAPMVAELAGAAWVVADRPAGVDSVAAAAGVALAAAAWVLTAFASRVHTALGRGLEPRSLRMLLAVHHARTAAWTAHALLAAVMAGQAA